MVAGMGKVVLHIRERAERRGIRNAYQLAQALGVPRNMGSRLWREDFTRVDLDTLGKLCEVLRCQPGALLTFEKEQRRDAN
ncbi:MAG: helix-turn-helix transcriptional regulator [Acidobacteriota bacterium]|nr:helix-turn-helix transcriptional regulator [Acidobacteriota bacterium]